MSAAELEGVLQAIGQMQSGWSENTALATLRADLEALYLSFAGVAGSRVETVHASGVAVDCVSAPGSDSSRVLLLFHGGGFSMGSARSHRHLAEWISSRTGCQVMLPDYRLVPKHVFPAQLDDACAVYHWLLERGPASVAVMGDSAGGGLCLALLGRLRETGSPMPACVCLMSPWLDLECRGDSYAAADDPVASREMALGMGQAYVGTDGDVTNPLASPVRLDFTGFPPLLVQVGSREIFLDDARFAAEAARAAGVTAELREWPGMIHQWHLYAAVLDEARLAIAQQADFLARHLP